MPAPSWLSYRQILKLRNLVPGLRRQHRRETMVGPLGHWEALRAYQLQALRQNGLSPHHRLLDLGCGPLQGGIAFIRFLEPGRYTGLDLHPAKLAEGYRQIAEFGLVDKNPRLVLSRSLGRDELGAPAFDFVWASQILYYFDTGLLDQLFARLAGWLAPEGKMLGDILGDCEPEFRTARHLEWIRAVQAHTPASLDALARPHGLQARSLGPIRQFGYPPALNLRSNLLIEITRRPPLPP